MRLQITKTYQWKNLQDLRENEDKNIIKKMYSNPEKNNKKTDFKSFEAKRDFTPGYVDKVNKTKLLIEILKNNEIKNALIFTRTKHGANKLAEIHFNYIHYFIDGLFS